MCSTAAEPAALGSAKLWSAAAQPPLWGGRGTAVKPCGAPAC